MKESKLTTEQESQIANLLKVIIEQSNLFPDTDPLLVKVSSLKLQGMDITLSEAKDLIRYVNRKIGKNHSYIDILNGTIVKYENSIGTIVTDVFEELEGVDIDDENDSLILWARNLSVIKNDVERFFEIDVIKSKLKSMYENGEIIIGNKRLKIKPNSNEDDFCTILFIDNPNPKTPVSWSDIWDKIKVQHATELGNKDFKVVENIKSRLNKELTNIGIGNILFSQKKQMMYRNY